MSVDHNDPMPGIDDAAGALIARGATADARAERRLAAIARDLADTDQARLDDETRAAVLAVLARLVGAIENDVRLYADRILTAKGGGLPAPTGNLVDRLVAGGILGNADLVGELVARAQSDLIAARLPADVHDDPERPSLLPRLVNGPDRVIASAAGAMMAADVRRRGGGTDAGRNDLPAELHHHLVWWIAAGLRPVVGHAADTALIEAARRALAAHDEGARLEATAERLAAALETSAEDLPDLFEEALFDRRLALVVALLAQALGIEARLTRDLMLDPAGDRLWLAMRSLDLPRATIARIGLALCEADRLRDAERFVDLLDPLMAMPVAVARDAIASLKLPADYRAAIAQLARAR